MLTRDRRCRTLSLIIAGTGKFDRRPEEYFSGSENPYRVISGSAYFKSTLRSVVIKIKGQSSSDEKSGSLEHETALLNLIEVKCFVSFRFVLLCVQ